MSDKNGLVWVKSALGKVDADLLEIFECDDNFAVITGYKKEEIVGNPLYLRILLGTQACDDLASMLKNWDYDKDVVRSFEAVIKYPGYRKPFPVYFSFSSLGVSENGNQIFTIMLVENSNVNLLEQQSGEEGIHTRLMVLLDNITKSFGGAVINFLIDDWSLRFYNESFLDILGYDKKGFAEIMNNDFRNLIEKDDRERVSNLIKEQVNNTEIIDVTFCARTIFGNQVWLTCKGRMVDAEGVRLCYTTINDITELRMVQDMLSEVNLRMETLISNIPGGVAMFLVDGDQLRAVYANDEYYRLFGYNRMEYENVSDNALTSIIHRKDSHLIMDAIRGDIGNKKRLRLELRAIKKDNSVIWVSVNARYYKNIDGRPAYYAIILDVTEQKNMEYALKLQTERYKLIQEAVNDSHFEYLAEKDQLYLYVRTPDEKFKK